MSGVVNRRKHSEPSVPRVAGGEFTLPASLLAVLNAPRAIRNVIQNK